MVTINDKFLHEQTVCSIETMYAVMNAKDKTSSNSPCAACKFLRRKCSQECVYAPYFPPDQPYKFANVHKVYGASNVAKLLNDLPTTKREDAVNSLAYEADARLRDPVYGCVGLISILQHRLKQVQMDLENAKRELANYTVGPYATISNLNQGLVQHKSNLGFVQNQPIVQDQHQQQKHRSLGAVLGTVSEFSHMAAAMSPCLSLGGSYDNNVYQQIQHQPRQHLHHQLFLQQQPLPLQGAE